MTLFWPRLFYVMPLPVRCRSRLWIIYELYIVIITFYVVYAGDEKVGGLYLYIRIMYINKVSAQTK